MADFLVIALDKLKRHLERTVTYRDRHYHGNVTDATDFLAITLDKRKRHLERIISYRDRYYHRNVIDVTDIVSKLKYFP